jgi:hypothetical protein
LGMSLCLLGMSLCLLEMSLCPILHVYEQMF